MNDIPLDLALETASPRGISYDIVLMIFLGAVVLFLFAAMTVVLRRLLTRPSMHGLTREQIRERWDEIERLTDDGGLMGAKMAIVEADKLLDGALKSLMIPGESLGERLKSAGYKYPELKHVWFAHKLRNQLVHEHSFEISHGQAKKALHEFKKALKVLNVL